MLASGVNDRPLDWSRDGKFVVYMSSNSGTTGHGLWLLPVEGDHKPISYLQTAFNEGEAQFSPDGKWMAYASNESGQPQVYVQGNSGRRSQMASLTRRRGPAQVAARWQGAILYFRGSEAYGRTYKKWRGFRGGRPATPF